ALRRAPQVREGFVAGGAFGRERERLAAPGPVAVPGDRLDQNGDFHDRPPIVANPRILPPNRKSRVPLAVPHYRSTDTRDPNWCKTHTAHTKRPERRAGALRLGIIGSF